MAAIVCSERAKDALAGDQLLVRCVAVVVTRGLVARKSVQVHSLPPRLAFGRCSAEGDGAEIG